MQQESWHEWRSKGIGASDAPIIMGVSPWKTRYQLWQEKTGRVKADKIGNWATQRGHDLEPKARAQYELETGNNCPPKLVEYAEAPFIRASLDGYDEKKNIVLEIKCPGAADHQKAMAGNVPDKYWPQLQHQLMITGANVAHYYSFDGEKGVLIEVLPDMKYCATLYSELRKFWICVETDTPPELTEKDYKIIKSDHLNELAEQWKKTVSVINELKEKEEELREAITSHELIKQHPFSKIGNLKVQLLSRKGNVDYSKIPELKSVDLERYRKKETTYYKFSEEK